MASIFFFTSVDFSIAWRPAVFGKILNFFKKAHEQNNPFYRAYDKVIAGIEAPEEVKAALRGEFVVALASGEARGVERTVAKHIAGTQWSWPEFNRWEKIFSETGYPYMWKQYIADTIFDDQITKADLIDELSVKAMREALKEKLGTLPGSPRKRVDFAELIEKTFSMQDLESTFGLTSSGLEEKRNQKAEYGRIQILAHYLTMTSYAFRNYQQWEQSSDFFWKRWKITASAIAGCPVEEEFANRFNSGKLKDYPPYFPGDRTSLRLTKKQRG